MLLRRVWHYVKRDTCVINPLSDIGEGGQIRSETVKRTAHMLNLFNYAEIYRAGEDFN